MKKRTPLSEFTDEEIISEAGRRRRAMAPKVTNPKVLRLCSKGCGKKFGARELRLHLPKCPGKSKPG